MAVPSRKKTLFFILAILIIILFWTSSGFESTFYRIVGFFEPYAQEYKAASMGIFVGLAALSTMLVSFSSIVLVPVASITFGKILTVILLLAGWCLGGILAYLIGRALGPLIIRRFFDVEKVHDYQDIMFSGKAGFGLILLTRFVLPAEVPGYLFGAGRYHFGRYLLATVTAETPYAVATVYFFDAIVHKNMLIVIIAASIWVILASLTALVAYRQIRKERMRTALEGERAHAPETPA